jgi:hypothetical protein
VIGAQPLFGPLDVFANLGVVSRFSVFLSQVVARGQSGPSLCFVPVSRRAVSAFVHHVGLIFSVLSGLSQRTCFWSFFLNIILLEPLGGEQQRLPWRRGPHLTPPAAGSGGSGASWARVTRDRTSSTREAELPATERAVAHELAKPATERAAIREPGRQGRRSGVGYSYVLLPLFILWSDFIFCLFIWPAACVIVWFGWYRRWRGLREIYKVSD